MHIRHERGRLMHWQFTPYVFPVAASAIISAALALTAWYRRQAPGAIAFCLLMLAVAEYSLGYVLELAHFDLPTILFWDNLEWVGATLAPLDRKSTRLNSSHLVISYAVFCLKKKK